MKSMYQFGLRSISVKHPRYDLKLVTRGNISRLEYQKAQAIISVIDSLEIRKIDIVAHSEGAINAIIVAHLYPEKINSMILVGPGGLTENESFFELLSRFIADAFQNNIDIFNLDELKLFIRSFVELFKYFLSNPILGLLEGSAVSHTHMYQYLIELSKYNIPITIILGKKDIIFPRNKMTDLSTLNGVTIVDMEGGHNDICFHPQRYANFIKDKLMV